MKRWEAEKIAIEQRVRVTRKCGCTFEYDQQENKWQYQPCCCEIFLYHFFGKQYGCEIQPYYVNSLGPNIDDYDIEVQEGRRRTFVENLEGKTKDTKYVKYEKKGTCHHEDFERIEDDKYKCKKCKEIFTAVQIGWR